MAQARSPWRDEEVWLERLQRDHDLLRERIGQERMMSLGTFLNVLDGDGWIDLLVVYGKAAREGIEATKDVDFYFEAPWIRGDDDPQRHIEVDEQ